MSNEAEQAAELSAHLRKVLDEITEDPHAFAGH